MKLYGNETAVIYSSKLLVQIGRYQLYKVKLKVHTRLFLLDHKPFQVYTTGLKRLNDNFFICIGKFNGK